MSHLAVSLLGTFQITLDGEPIAFSSVKARALLAYLAVESTRPHPRETLTALLWPEEPASVAHNNFRHTLSSLRKVIGDRERAESPLLLVSREMVQFNCTSDCWLDVRAFQEGIKNADSDSQLIDAVALYRGDFLEGFYVKDSVAFEDWVSLVRDRLQRHATTALQHLVEISENRGDYAQACAYAWRWIELEPWQEDAYQYLMRALALNGQRTTALAQYDVCRNILQEEFGVEPSAQTLCLYEHIRDGEIYPPTKSTSGAQPAPLLLASPAPPLPIHSTSLPALESERRVVTLLLADVNGPALLLKRRHTEAWAEFITPALHLLGAEIARFGGNVEQYRCAGLTACFGGQVAHEDDPERALLAALAMQEALTPYLTENDATDLYLTISVHTGEVIFTAIGDTVSLMGDVFDNAERIQAALEPDTIWVNPETHHLIVSLFTWAPREGGGYQPLTHRLQVDKGRGIAGLSSPLVGREAELRALQEAVERLQAGMGGIVTLIGEAGIGKSRLVAELKRSAVSQHPSTGLAWIEGRCLSYATGTAYQAWIDVLRNWLDVAQDVPSAEVRDTLRTRMDTLCPNRVDEVYPFLARMMSLSLDVSAEVRLRGIEGEGLQVLTFRAAETWLEQAAREAPLVIVCEDLHWADPTSLELLRHLMTLTDSLPILLICVFRAETEHPCWKIKETAARCYAHRHIDLWLHPLSVSESTQLIDSLLPAENLPSRLRDRILDRAEGNPFYVEEILRSLIDGGTLAYDVVGRRWQAVQEVSEFILPATLRGVLMARIDRLPRGARHVLQLASVVGRIVSSNLLRSIATLSLMSLDEHLLTLQREQLLCERTRVPEATYIFKHQLTQEAAYDSLLYRKRRVLHRRVAEVLERHFPERVEENLGLLAHHWEQAGAIERAIPYLLRVGDKATVQYANEEARNYYQHAIMMLEGLEPNNTYQNWRLKALNSLGKLCFTEGKISEAENHFREAIALGRSMRINLQELLLLYYWLGETLWWQSRYEEHLRVGEEGLALLGDDKESLAAALMNQIVATSMWMLGSPEQGMGITQRTAQFIQHIPYVEELCVVYESVIQARIIRKDVTGAYKWLQLFEENVTARHDLLGLVMAYRYMGDVLRRTGDLASAIQRCSKRLDLCVRMGDSKYESRALSELAQLSLHSGEIQKAAGYTDQALPMHLAVGYAPDMANCYCLIGEIAICQNEYAKAITAFKQALLLHQDAKSLYGPVQLHYRLGRTYLGCKNYTKALQCFQDSLIALAKIESLVLLQPAIRFFPLLSGFEEACADFSVFQALCQQIQVEHFQFKAFLTQWHLESANIKRMHQPFTLDEFKTLEDDWTWYDPFDDCSYKVRDALTIYAVNGRDLWYINKSAPRLMRTLSIGVSDLVVQVMSKQASDDRPAVGGLLLWSDDQNYLWVQRGRFGSRDIAFGGCMNNKDIIVGRGQTPIEESSECIFLRMEYTRGEVKAFCSTDNEQWFSIGDTPFLVENRMQVGVYAIGNIDRIVYHGAYPDGTAIRFTSFQLWESQGN